MPVHVLCPRCARNLNVPEGSLGQPGRCPSCNHVFALANDSFQSSPLTAHQTAFSAVPSVGGNEQPPYDLDTSDRNEFANFRSNGRAVYTPPRTFHMLFRWLAIASATQFLMGGMIFVLIADKENLPPGKTISGAYLSVGWKTIYFSELSEDEFAAFLGTSGLLILGMIAEAVLFFVLLYKCWALIQDGHPQTTPGRAVGFWFIPLYNLYWIFVSVRGLAEDLNRYASRRGLAIQSVSVGLATLFCVVKLGSMMPLRFEPISSFVGYLAIPAMLLELLVMYQIKNAAAGIAAAKVA